MLIDEQQAAARRPSRRRTASSATCANPTGERNRCSGRRPGLLSSGEHVEVVRDPRRREDLPSAVTDVAADGRRPAAAPRPSAPTTPGCGTSRRSVAMPATTTLLTVVGRSAASVDVAIVTCSPSRSTTNCTTSPALRCSAGSTRRRPASQLVIGVPSIDDERVARLRSRPPWRRASSSSSVVVSARWRVRRLRRRTPRTSARTRSRSAPPARPPRPRPSGRTPFDRYARGSSSGATSSRLVMPMMRQ